MSAARSKGTGWESELLPLIRTIWPDADRAPLKGVNDMGDFLNVPYVLEAKKTDVPHFLQWAKTCAKKDENWRVLWSGDRRKGDGPFVMLGLQQWLTLESRAAVAQRMGLTF